MLLVDKYKPRTIAEICGGAPRLVEFLSKWDAKRTPKAILLSGPPGIGKTTSAHVVAKSMGLAVVEVNASDDRDKKAFESVNTTSQSIDVYTGARAGNSSFKSCLIFDEVDGLCGNADRGGMREIVSLIKGTKIPVICICNDSNSPKMKSLKNVCQDSPMKPPLVYEMMSRLREICAKEAIMIQPEELAAVAKCQDMRQALNVLQMWAGSPKADAKKDVRLNPFEASRKLFDTSCDMDELTDCFLSDSSLVPLLFQENYLKASGSIEQFASAGECLSDSDLLQARQQKTQDWSLMPVEAAMYVSSARKLGGFYSQMNFPSFLGKTSKISRCARERRSLASAFRMTYSEMEDYRPMLVHELSAPMVQGKQGVEVVVKKMKEYGLTRDDWVMLIDDKVKIDSAVKAAFTRALGKKERRGAVEESDEDDPMDAANKFAVKQPAETKRANTCKKAPKAAAKQAGKPRKSSANYANHANQPAAKSFTNHANQPAKTFVNHTNPPAKTFVNHANQPAKTFANQPAAKTFANYANQPVVNYGNHADQKVASAKPPQKAKPAAKRPRSTKACKEVAKKPRTLLTMLKPLVKPVLS